MASIYETIPPAVAAIVTTIISHRSLKVENEGDLDKLQKRVVELTDQLSRTFARALDDAQTKQA